MSTPDNRIGISLSGGGYRAAAFHLGTLKKLQELGILQNAGVMSTISGGSITGACYCSRDGDFDSFYNKMYADLQTKNVIKKVLLSPTFFGLVIFALIILGPAIYFLFTDYAWLFPVLLICFIFLLFRFQFQIFPVSKRIEKIYDEFFYQNKKLGDLPVKPLLVIGSTNLQTARPFTFSRSFMQDSTYQFMTDPVKFKAEKFPISRAVMASSCVPFAFTPVTIDEEFFEDPAEAKKFHPMLVDGGVYDNQGIHKVMQSGFYACPIVITSDAGAGGSGELQFKNKIALLIETVNVFMSRIKNIQMIRNVYDNASTANRQVAYFSLGWDMENCIKGFITNLEKKQIPQSVLKAHQLKQEWIDQPKKYESEITALLKQITDYDKIDKPAANEKKIARKVGTNLTALSKIKVDCLIKQAKALTEIQVKLYCPSLFQK